MESHSKEWERLEVRYADAKHSPWGILVDPASTSLTLRLLEHKRLFTKTVWEGLRIKELAKSVHWVSQDQRLERRYELASGERLKAFELQQRLAEMAINLSTKVALPEDEVWAAYEWYSVCDDLKMYKPNDPSSLDPLADRVEWAARLRAIHYQNRRKGANKVSRSNIVAASVDQVWDRIYPASITDKYWHREQADFYTKHGLTITELMYTPPRLTRAYIRSKALKNGFTVPNGTWDCVRDSRGNIIPYPDPYDYGN